MMAFQQPVFLGLNKRLQCLLSARKLLPAIAVFTLGSLITLSPTKSSAVSGFTTPFQPGAWTYTVSPTPETVATSCDFNDPAFGLPCLDINANSGDVTLGLAKGSSQTSAQWQWTNTTNTTYYVSFNYFLDTDPDSTPSAYGSYTVGTSPEGSSGPIYFSGNILTANNLIVAPTESIVFNLTVPTTGSDSTFAITGFNAVPAPMPAAGAATAFSFSRRLRRRIKGPRAKGSCPPVAPPHPSIYLNLAPATLKSLPVSFNYSLHSCTSEATKRAA